MELSGLQGGAAAAGGVWSVLLSAEKGARISKWIVNSSSIKG